MESYVNCNPVFLMVRLQWFPILRYISGKHKAMKPGDKVCVGYSGGGASSSQCKGLYMYFVKIVRIKDI